VYEKSFKQDRQCLNWSLKEPQQIELSRTQETETILRTTDDAVLMQTEPAPVCNTDTVLLILWQEARKSKSEHSVICTSQVLYRL